MIEYKNVQGSMEEVPYTEFGLTTIYVRTNVVKLEGSNNWQYDEIQYTYDEWSKLQSEEIESLKIENKELKESQVRQDNEILESMLASTELFEMILGISAQTLNNTNVKNIGGRNMVQVYVTLILKGVKTIDDVPVMIREEVQKQLDIVLK
ncbi:MAG: hypothetical protein IJH34_09010 [Romboutsia sp.]|nr:hypothetical protein [Romboutsia sp.]